MLRIIAHIPPKVKTLNGEPLPRSGWVERVPLPVQTRAPSKCPAKLKIIKILIKIVH